MGRSSGRVIIDMLKERESIEELEDRLACLMAELYQMCGSMTVGSLESLCRRIHIIQFKLKSSSKEGIYGKK